MALLFQQGDEPLFGADVAVDELVGVVEVADDGGLLVEWGIAWDMLPMKRQSARGIFAPKVEALTSSMTCFERISNSR